MYTGCIVGVQGLYRGCLGAGTPWPPQRATCPWRRTRTRGSGSRVRDNRERRVSVYEEAPGLRLGLRGSARTSTRTHMGGARTTYLEGDCVCDCAYISAEEYWGRGRFDVGGVVVLNTTPLPGRKWRRAQSPRRAAGLCCPCAGAYTLPLFGSV